MFIRSLLFLSIFLSSLAALAQSTAAQGPVPQSTVAPDLPARADAGPVRVIIQVRAPVMPEGAMGLDAVLDQRGRIAAVQDLVLAGSNATAVVRFASLPFVAAEVSRGELDRLAAHPDVVRVDEDVILHPALIESVPRIGAPAVWQGGIDGTGWSVAILDSGVDAMHPVLAGKVQQEACFSTTDAVAESLCPGGVSSSTVAGSGAPCPPGVSGCDHGTHVAGIAAARYGDGGGVARGADVIAVQVFSRFMTGCGTSPAPCALAYTSDVVRALEHVATLAGPENVTRVAAVNLSLAGTVYTAACDTEAGMPLVKGAIDNLVSLGIPTVMASGNDGSWTGVAAPACVSTGVSVGATYDTGTPDTVTSFSNRASFLSLLAPGSAITSSAPGGGFQTKIGTSMASPHVAGAWALLKQAVPDASVATILSALRSTGLMVEDWAVPGTSYPRIRVDLALESLGAAGLPDAPTDLASTIQGSLVELAWQPPAGGGTPAAYVVEAGSTSGASDIGVFVLGAAPAFAVMAPDGVYHVRVRARNVFGTGPASNEVMVVVGAVDTAVPLAPIDVVPFVAGRVVSLAWAVDPASPSVAAFIVDVGTAPGQSDLGSFDLGSPVTGAVATMVPGTYFVRVRARNALGIGPASEEATFTVLPCTPAAPAGLSFAIAAGVVTVTWEPPAEGDVTSYVIEAGDGPGASNLLVFNTGSAAPSFAAVAPPGAYYVRVRAMNTCGASPASEEIVVTVE